MCVVDAALLFQAKSPILTPRQPSLRRFPQKECSFPLILMIKECRHPWLRQWKIFLQKHIVQVLLRGKNSHFCVFERIRRENNLEIWTDSIPVHLLIPFFFSLPPFSFFILSGFQQCVSRCLSQCLELSTHLVSILFMLENHSKQNIFPSFFYQQCLFSPEFYWNLMLSQIRKTQQHFLYVQAHLKNGCYIYSGGNYFYFLQDHLLLPQDTWPFSLLW